MIDNFEIGNRIKKRRTELGLTMQKVADDVGLNKSTIQRYESGNIKDIKIPIIESIGKALNVDPMWLIGKSDYKSKSEEYEKVTYLSNLYFKSIMNWSEDKLLNESETIMLRGHFSELLLRYKTILESYVNSKSHWKLYQQNFENLYKDRFTALEIRELFLKQELDSNLNYISSWIESFPNWIAGNEKTIESNKEINNVTNLSKREKQIWEEPGKEYLMPIASHDIDGEFSEEDYKHDDDLMNDEDIWK
ncbi:TPA: helix-turn-helix domain-containing protein [Clostridium perfringens]|uniref:helix-turn-helix domain-containing protein n=1 Tax=Clostridium perfringens TaxID=1502 RepID=UPI001B8142FD|nr:helix-turn-helix domain-containing protein [Clostridium perfringens]MDH2475930.1 helix-turn-helix domain-containing protein [Clostridium perfringens]HBC2028633.1 helix-turn-helix domain-containing protein [Clostridium perfringens]HBC2031964.1 helix-turn-helix domain-containing protein [Clostridium perfringens]HBC2055699.1 helix-turn-helix domain-containing protein [Clostridium perfringens]HBC2069315.1 helix-turn-helix domain-containing protein [Clostridium perfringens]